LIISAKKSHCHDIARLHAQEIGTGFLSRIGDRFLIELYEAAQQSRHAILLVSIHEEDTIDGYVSASVNTRKFYSDFLLGKHFLKSIPALLGSLFFQRSPRDPGDREEAGTRLVKYWETFTYPFRNKGGAVCDYELLSIVVQENTRGKGVADALLTELKNRFFKHGITCFQVVVGSANKRACRFYERNGGRLLTEVEVHRGEKSKIYIIGSR
jgi:ribosomal protein S18 acetylase RimI-like enzyme